MDLDSTKAGHYTGQAVVGVLIVNFNYLNYIYNSLLHSKNASSKQQLRTAYWWVSLRVSHVEFKKGSTSK